MHNIIRTLLACELGAAYLAFVRARRTDVHNTALTRDEEATQ